MTMNAKIGFLGAGRMASAIAGGMVKNAFIQDNILFYDCSEAAAGAFEAAVGAKKCADPAAMAEACDAVLLAVKPQYLSEALKPLTGLLKNKLVISIVAGVKLEKLAALTGASRIVRVMPNTPALVGEGAAVYAASAGAEKSDIELADKIFSSVGTALQLSENYLDAVTAVSGSGPAYVFEFIQAMADGGVAEGLPREIALKLAAQTVLGAATMVLKTGAHPQQLKDNVTSPAGTTSRALEVMAARGFSGIVMQSVRAAAERSRELGGRK